MKKNKLKKDFAHTPNLASQKSAVQSTMPKLVSGFTLIETMIYIALFGIIMSGALIGTYNLLEGGERNVNSSKIETEGAFLNRKINWALIGATDVLVTGGGTIITITRPDLETQSPIVISGNGTKITLARGTGPALDLNNERFEVSDVLFVHTPGVNGRPPSVNTNFIIEGKLFNFRNYIRR